MPNIICPECHRNLATPSLLNGKWRMRCACGWTGPDGDTIREAEALADNTFTGIESEEK